MKTKHYRQLTEEERSELQTHKAQGLVPKEIAPLMNRHLSTIYRELNRNCPPDKAYHGYVAQEAAEERRSQAARPTVCAPENQAIIAGLLEAPSNGLNSPDVIAGRGRVVDLGIKISASSIYKIIALDRARGGKLYLHLPRGGRRYRKNRVGRQRHKLDIQEGQNLADRPEGINQRSEPGHLEADLVQAGETIILTMVDRYTREATVRALPSKEADAIQVAVNLILESGDIRSMTFDRGMEWALINRMVVDFHHVNIYFARPYTSWEKGSIENLNRLLRRYWPKGKNAPWHEGSEEEARAVERLMNNTPRKLLGYRTPNEAAAEWPASRRRAAWKETYQKAS